MPPRALTYWWWAKHFQFTQKQVDCEQSLEIYEWLPKIEAGYQRAIEMERKRHDRQSRMGR